MEELRGIGYLESLNKGPMRLGLEAMTELMEKIEWPDRSLKIIHIAGTNGKGSVSQMVSSILIHGNYKVGVFNSPHLITPEECIKINNEAIEREVFEQYIEELKPVITQLQQQDIWPSSFEVLTAISLMYFKRQKVDFVVLEVGLGGRLDATNVIGGSLLSVITKIALDHKDFLGDTVEQIATQKAGIIKQGGRVVTAIQGLEVDRVIEEVSENKQAVYAKMDPQQIEEVSLSEEGTQFMYQSKLYKTGLIGYHQAYNGALAIAVIQDLQAIGAVQVEEQAVLVGLEKAKWEGRFEKIYHKPSCYIDGAHNVDGIKALKKTLDYFNTPYRIGIIGLLADKEVEEILEIIAPSFHKLIVTTPISPRALSANKLGEVAAKYHQDIEVIDTIEEATQKALAYGASREGSQVIAFGSLYMIGKVRAEISSYS